MLGRRDFSPPEEYLTQQLRGQDEFKEEDLGYHEDEELSEVWYKMKQGS